MRRIGLGLLFTVLYFVLIGGNTYYNAIFAVRVFHHIFIPMILGGWLWHQFRREGGVVKTGLEWPIAAMLSLYVIAAAFSLDPRMAMEHLWLLFTHVLLFYGIVTYLQDSQQRIIMDVTFFMFGVVVLFTLIEIASWFFGLGITPGTERGWLETGMVPRLADLPTITLVFAIPTIIAGFVAPATVITFGWALTTQRRDYRNALLVLAFLLLVTLLLTKARGGVLSLLAASGAWVVVRVIRDPRVQARLSWPVILAGIGVLSVGGVAVITALLIPLGKAITVSDRFEVYETALLIAREHWLFGVGPGIFAQAYWDFRDPLEQSGIFSHAHNVVLNTLAETGLLGFVVGIWMLSAIVWLTWRNWHQTTNVGHRRRIEVMLAALAGIAVHNLVETFLLTAQVMLVLLLIAYLITPLPHSRFDAKTTRLAWLAFGFGITIIISSGLMLLSDRAQWFYLQSLDDRRGREVQFALVERAIAADGAMRLYPMWQAQLLANTGQQSEAISAYEDVLQRFPIWEVGWVNLGLLYEQSGDLERAREAFNRGYALNPMSADVALTVLPIFERYEWSNPAATEAGYLSYLQNQFPAQAPTSDFWWQTPIRLAALRTFEPSLSLEEAYLLRVTYFRNSVEELFPDNPQTAIEWWIQCVERQQTRDYDVALNACNQAVMLDPYDGDHYVARAQVYIALGQEDAGLRDLSVAERMGRVTYTQVATVRAQITDDLAERMDLLIGAVSPPARLQRVGASYFNRPARFGVLAPLPGQGAHRIQPWYDLATIYEERGQEADAIEVYRAILRVAPFEEDAQAALANR